MDITNFQGLTKDLLDHKFDESCLSDSGLAHYNDWNIADCFLNDVTDLKKVIFGQSILIEGFNFFLNLLQASEKVLILWDRIKDFHDFLLLVLLF